MSLQRPNIMGRGKGIEARSSRFLQAVPLSAGDVEPGDVAVCVAHLPRSRCFGAMAGTSCERHGFYERVSKTRGRFMSPAELIAVFRLYADRCVEIAQDLPDVGHRAALLNMARTWFEAADQLEQNGVILGVSLMSSQLSSQLDKSCGAG